MGKELKVGVRLGAGPEPGYRWDAWVLDLAYREAMGFLSPDQYEHESDQVRQLAREMDPSHSRVQSVDAIDDFFELRDKGGPLGKINVRIFFWLDTRAKDGRRHHAIVVLGAIKKENNGPTPSWDKIRIGRRLRKYKAGDYGPPPS